MYKVVLFLVSFTLAGIAVAGEPLRIETEDQARQRHSAENYEFYKGNRNRAPLGGYPQRFGDPAPRGTEQPGYKSKGYESYDYNYND